MKTKTCHLFIGALTASMWWWCAHHAFVKHYMTAHAIAGTAIALTICCVMIVGNETEE